MLIPREHFHAVLNFLCLAAIMTFKIKAESFAVPSKGLLMVFFDTCHYVLLMPVVATGKFEQRTASLSFGLDPDSNIGFVITVDTWVSSLLVRFGFLVNSCYNIRQVKETRCIFTLLLIRI